MQEMMLPGIIQFRKCTLSDADLCKAVAEHLRLMYEPPYRTPSRSIPARPNEDFDLLLGELIFRVYGRVPNSYILDFDARRSQNICAIATAYNEDKRPCQWAIRIGKCCMSKLTGHFTGEPFSRKYSPEFTAEYRFENIEEIEQCYARLKNENKI